MQQCNLLEIAELIAQLPDSHGQRKIDDFELYKRIDRIKAELDKCALNCPYVKKEGKPDVLTTPA